MTTMNCEYVRAVYPDVLHGACDAATTHAVQQHLAGCAECRAEAALVAELLAAPRAVPAGLEARVLAAVQAPSAIQRQWPRRLVLAAAMAVALVGGSLLFDRMTSSTPPTAVVQNDQGGLGVVGVESAVVSGTVSLRDLTVEELEQLLGEMES